MSSYLGKTVDNNLLEDVAQLGSRLHQRLLAGDVTTFAEIAEFALPILTERLSKKFPNLDDPHLVDMAVVDALMSYQGHPTQYNSSKLRLEQYLYMSARGDLLNLLKKQNKDIALVPLVEIVELEEPGSEYGVEVKDDVNIENEVTEKLSPTWRNICALLPDPIDQEMVQLMMDGTRETDIYAEVLGITALPADEQFSTVKRNKDRIKKILLRHIIPLDLKK